MSQHNNNMNLRETDITDMVISTHGESIPQEPAEYAWLDEITPEHHHHFTYQINANHTALRGCYCGLAFIGHMVGSAEHLVWHQVHEVEE